MNRLLLAKDIPASLWEKDKSTLLLPPQLISKWEMLLDKYHLRDKAMAEAPKKVIGGAGKEDTDNFLAWRFAASSGRVMIAMLDPYQVLPGIPDVFAQVFSGNKVFLADLPCGSGAASLSILATLYELRKQKKIPRMPLHVILLGGEISEHAQQYAKEALEAMSQDLKTQAITLEFQIKYWDACDRFSNTELIKDLTISSQDCPSKLLFLVNFSGFLEGQGNWNKAKNQFDELFRYSEGSNSIALCIEPMKNNVIKNGFFKRLVKWFKDQFSKSFEFAEDDHYPCSTVKLQHPLRDHIFNGNRPRNFN